MYNEAVKALLGVRSSAGNNLCIIECNLKPLDGIVNDRQKKFFEKMSSRPPHYADSLQLALKMVNAMHKPMKVYIDSISNGSNFAAQELQKMKDAVTHASVIVSRVIG